MTIQSKLELARRSLLDLSRRNRLLNFRPRGRSSIRIVDEVPEEVYRLLVTEGKRLQFLAVEEARIAVTGEGEETISEGAAEEIFDLAAIDEAGAPPDRHTDLRLQTALGGKPLQSRLLHLDREASSALQEHGSSVLYLALGMLQWVDTDDANTTSRAPLLLIPAELVRRTARHRHAVRMLDEEVVVNPSLIELCARKFDLKLPDLDPEAESPVESFFAAVERTLKDMPGWRVLPEMHVGLFSFAKLLMYLDLQDESWPETARISAHPLVRTLFGLGNGEREATGEAAVAPGSRVGGTVAPPGEAPPSEIDESLSPLENFQILDADSSQQVAILAARSGASMVIEGPPGTGKSQTIANIIGECLAAGKTVLFVAEKMAALEVVERRLTLAGLGDFAAELHSRKASKKRFLEEIGRAMETRHATPEGRDETLAAELSDLRSRLNAHVSALHEAVEPLGVSIFEAVGLCASLESAPEAAVDLGDLTTWDRERLETCEELVAGLVEAVERIGDPSGHPWRGTGLTELPLPLRQRLPGEMDAVTGALAELRRRADPPGEHLESAHPASVAAVRELLELCDTLLAAPPPEIEKVTSPVWDSMPPEVHVLLNSGRRIAELRGRLAPRWKDSAEGLDWTVVAERRSRQVGSILRFLSPKWWGDSRRIRRHLRPRMRPRAEQVLEDLAALGEMRRLREKLSTLELRAFELFGGHWRDHESDWDQLEACAAAAISIRQRVREGRLTGEGLRTLASEAGRRELESTASDLRSALEELRGRWELLSRSLELEPRQFLGSDPETLPLDDWLSRLEEAGREMEALSDWVTYRRAMAGCVDAGLGRFVEWAESVREAHPPGTWPGAFRRQFHRLWLDAVTRLVPALSRFLGASHQRLVQRFRLADRQWIERTRKRLAARLALERPRLSQVTSSGSGLGLLKAEIRRKRGIKPIRRLLASAPGAAIQRIKPCFMMSPMSVAQFLEPGKLNFDVVIFDEASQIEPADALGAVARGQQVILVGDEKQLPPTTFFATHVDVEGDEEEDEILSSTDLESVLAVGQSFLPLRTTLRWHYRSRHQSLIDFSNSEFYDNQLRVFPSPSVREEQLGLWFRHVPDGVYDRGRGRFNRVEARAVAAAALEHARTTPHLSLGIAAFSISQQRAIEDEIERIRREEVDDALEEFFSAEREEPFFVKNLETVQGDERDVILLSVGYGPDERGKMSMNFGPLNKPGGWRRLNVLVTRARRCCRIFSSITAEEIRADESTPRGVVALRNYLHYARSRSSTNGTRVRPREAASRFVRAVCEQLREHGWEVHPAVGHGDFSIDLAIVDPDDRRRYLLGIECDGATYGASRTARDRDRLRQSVLESLGWKMLRIWSLDWFQQPKKSLHALLGQIRQVAMVRSRAGRKAPSRPPEKRPAAGSGDSSGEGESDPVAEEPESTDPALPRGVVPYRRFDDPGRGDREVLVRSSPRKIRGLLGKLVAVEGPIHRDELLRVAASLYSTRAAGEARDVLTDALASAVRDGSLVERESFLWPPGMERPPIRWRGGDDAVTSADLIAPEEVAEAAVRVVQNEFGVPARELPAAAIRLLGFRRVGPQLGELGEAGVRIAREQGRIREEGNGYIVRVEPEGPAT